MNAKDALSILGLGAIASQEAIKAQYRKAAFKYHPDRNAAGLEMMKACNTAYQFLTEISYDGTDSPIQDEVNADYGEELNNALNAVVGLAGLEIEVCGSWLWITGNTRLHKTVIKEAGFWWAKKKLAWYFRPADYKSKGRGKFSMDDIRSKYGSESVANKARPVITH